MKRGAGIVVMQQSVGGPHCVLKSSGDARCRAAVVLLLDCLHNELRGCPCPARRGRRLRQNPQLSPALGAAARPFLPRFEDEVTSVLPYSACDSKL